MKIALIAFCAVSGLFLWWGFVLSCLWDWFLVPFGLPSITTVEATGLVVLLTMFMPVSDPRRSGYNVIVLTVRPLFLLLFGLVLRAFS